MGVQRFVHSVCEQVKPGKEGAGKREILPLVEVGSGAIDQVTEGGLRGSVPRPEIAEARFYEDSGGHRQRSLDEERWGRVSSDVAKDDAGAGRTDNAGSQRVIRWGFNQYPRPAHSGDAGKRADTDGQCDVFDARAEGGQNADGDEQAGKCQERINEAYEERVDDSAHVSGEETDDRPQRPEVQLGRCVENASAAGKRGIWRILVLGSTGREQTRNLALVVSEFG